MGLCLRFPARRNYMHEFLQTMHSKSIFRAFNYLFKYVKFLTLSYIIFFQQQTVMYK